MSRPRNDGTSVLAFGAFWVVICVGVLLGYVIVHGFGAGGRTQPVAASGRHVTPSAASIRGSSQVNPLSLDSIFSSRLPSLARYEPGSLRTLIATGDVIPARSVNYRMVTLNDFLYPFRPTGGYLRKGDMTLINLEAPLVAGCPITDSGMTFCGDPRAVEGLKYAGVTTACTANNHIGNYGPQGIQETWAHLKEVGIGYCGLGKVDHKTIRGLTFAFLAYNCVGNRFDYLQARKDIHEARKHAAVVIVSVHWGKEYVFVPAISPGIADDDPVKVGHWIIDSGADLVIGNHPHHVQAVEIFHNHLITYAHGNFAFDQMFSDETRQGVVGTYWFSGRRLVAVHYRPVFIYDYAQPRWATPAQARTIIREMRNASVELARGRRG